MEVLKLIGNALGSFYEENMSFKEFDLLVRVCVLVGIDIYEV